jgi:hypothetical protein
MRNFTDSAGVEWMVFEVKRQGEDEDNWAYLPRGFRAGWLCFESSAGKRRLSPVPDGWKLKNAPDLEQLLRRAAVVVRTRRAVESEELHPGATDDQEFRP